MASNLVFLCDQLDRAGLLFTSGLELLLVPGYYRHLIEMVQEINIETATSKDATVATLWSALASYTEVLCMVESARYAYDAYSTT